MRLSRFLPALALLAFAGCASPTSQAPGSAPDAVPRSFAFSSAQYQTAFNAFLSSYYINAGDFRTSLTDGGAQHFWEASFDRQLLAENFNATGLNKDKVSEAFYKFENSRNTNRFGNPKCWIVNDSDWNDDYSWATQFALAAYAVTGDQHMLDQAKWHFDYFYSNNVDNTWGGGMWRERGVRNQKDVPTNGWGIVAAKLARYYPTATLHNNLTGADRTYLQMAQDTYSWIKTSFLRSDGGVMNSITTDHLGWDDNLYTYNAGIFLELAANLYDLTKNTSYLTDAKKAADFARVHFTTGTNQVIVYEDDVGGGGLYRPDPTTSYETVFKGILIRGVYNLIKLGGQTQYVDWLGNNAQAAWLNRKANNLTAPQLDTPFGTNARSTAVASGTVAMAYSLMAGSPSTVYYRIKDRWKNNYLHLQDKNGKVQYGALQSGWLSMKWVVEDAGSGNRRIKNAWSGDYLNIESHTGTLQYSPLNSSWLSMQWKLLPAVDAGYTNIQSAWSTYPWYFNVENQLGYIQTGTIQPNWQSAEWVLEPTN